MDPATFKLVLEHQKEYSLEDKAIQSRDPIMIAGKKEWSTFWTASTKKARKKKKRLNLSGKKAQAVKKAREEFLDQIHDLNTPMLWCNDEDN